MDIDVYIFITGSKNSLQCAYSAMKTVKDLEGIQMFNGVNAGDGARVINHTPDRITVEAFGVKQHIDAGKHHDFKADASGQPVESKGDTSVYLSLLNQKVDDGQTDVPIGQILVLGPINPGT